MSISARSLIVEYKDLISLLFQVSSAAVFTVAQEVPAMAQLPDSSGCFMGTLMLHFRKDFKMCCLFQDAEESRICRKVNKREDVRELPKNSQTRNQTDKQ